MSDYDIIIYILLYIIYYQYIKFINDWYINKLLTADSYIKEL